MSNLKPTEIVLTNVRLAYAAVWEPKALTPKEAAAGKTPKYQATFLLDKNDPQIPAIKAAIAAAFLAGVTKKFGGVAPKKWHDPLGDGDSPKVTDGEERGPEFKGKYFITASTSDRPELIYNEFDKLANAPKSIPVEKRRDLYSGCFVNAAINFGAFDNETKGVGAYLAAIMKVADGDPLGPVGLSAKRAFSSYFNDAVDKPEPNTAPNTAAAPAASSAKPWETAAPGAGGAKPWETAAPAAPTKKPWE